MKVTVYSTQTCPWCFKLKDFLTENHIEFSDVDVGTNQDEAKKLVDKTGNTAVPQMIVEKDDGSEEFVIGMDVEKIKKIFDLK